MSRTSRYAQLRVIALKASELSVGNYLDFQFDGVDYTIARTYTNFHVRTQNCDYIECYPYNLNRFTRSISANQIYKTIGLIAVRDVHQL